MGRMVDRMPDSATLESAGPRSVGEDAAPSLEALVVVWSGDEPSRVGEVVLFPPASDRRSFVFGRGEGSDGRHERARFAFRVLSAVLEQDFDETLNLTEGADDLRRGPADRVAADEAPHNPEQAGTRKSEAG